MREETYKVLWYLLYVVFFTFLLDGMMTSCSRTVLREMTGKRKWDILPAFFKIDMLYLIYMMTILIGNLIFHTLFRGKNSLMIPCVQNSTKSSWKNMSNNVQNWLLQDPRVLMHNSMSIVAFCNRSVLCYECSSKIESYLPFVFWKGDNTGLLSKEPMTSL